MAVAHEGKVGPFLSAGAPVDGTDCIQTITIGGTATGGTFKLTFNGFTTGAITWSATTGTLIGNVDAALGALPNVGSVSNVTTTDATLSSGNGTFTVTFVAALGKLVQPVMTVTNNLTSSGTATLACAITTPGVTATARGCSIGATLKDTTNGKLYINTGTAAAPTWTVVGAQTT